MIDVRKSSVKDLRLEDEVVVSADFASALTKEDLVFDRFEAGTECRAEGENSTAVGFKSVAVGAHSHTEGGYEGVDLPNYAFGDSSHSEGDGGNCAGTMSYNILGADDATLTLTLDSVEGLQPSMQVAMGYAA